MGESLPPPRDAEMVVSLTQVVFKGAETNDSWSLKYFVLHINQNFVLISKFCLKLRIQISLQITFPSQTKVERSRADNLIGHSKENP